MDEAKPFDISKREVWEAFKKVTRAFCRNPLRAGYAFRGFKLGPVQRDARDITTWVGEAGDNTVAHWVAYRRHNDRNGGGGSLRGESSRRACADDRVRTKLNEL